jgi:hypothetical protein
MQASIQLSAEGLFWLSLDEHESSSTMSSAHTNKLVILHAPQYHIASMLITTSFNKKDYTHSRIYETQEKLPASL